MDTSTQKTEPTGDRIADRLVAFAEQLAVLVGTVQAKAEGWRDRAMLTREIGRIRDSAADLLAHLNREDAVRQTPAKRTAPSATRRSRGPVEAPGKRHRTPLPQERIDKRMGRAQRQTDGAEEFQEWQAQRPRLTPPTPPSTASPRASRKCPANTNQRLCS